MKRIRLSSSVLTIVGLLVSVGPVSLAAQNTRPRGEAAAAGHAVPRDRTERATQSEVRAPQRESRRAEPARDQATTTRVPGVVVPRVIQPQVARSQGETVRPNDHPAYRPDYRPNYQPQYEPNYRPLDHPDYHRSYRPYYTFRPRLLLGFGVWVGYPVTYPAYFYPSDPDPNAYPAPYPNAYPDPTEPYPAPGTVAAAVGGAGGLSFEIRPVEAGVYVDDQYVGTVGQFSPNQPPLSLAPGRHHVEIRQPGFEMTAFDVDILPGQVIPYQGDLRPY